MPAPSGLQIMFLTTKGIENLDPSLAFSQRFVDFLEHVVDPACAHDHAVHAEIILNGVAYSAVGRHSGSCILHYRPDPAVFLYDCIELYEIPLTNYTIAQNFLSLATSTRATYNIPYTEFFLPRLVLDYVDPELECGNPSSWAHLYCSQFVLLFLRYCAQQNIMQLDPEKLASLDPKHINSHQCSPARLMHILKTWGIKPNAAGT